METMIMEFAEQLFTFLARKYDIGSTNGSAEGGAPIKQPTCQSNEFSIDIVRAVLMLSYTYRTSFRKHFKSVSPLLCKSRDSAKLFPIIFARVTYKCHSPLKILIICSFISEMYLYIFFQTQSKDASRCYITPSVNSFTSIYKSVFRRIDDPIPKWDDVKNSASLVAKGYAILVPIMNTEHPSESKLFFTSVQDVLAAAEGVTTEPGASSDGFRTEAASEQLYKAASEDSEAKERYIAGGRRLLVQTAQTGMAAQQDPSNAAAASASKSDDANAKGQSKKSRGKKKAKKASLKTKALAKPNAPEDKAGAKSGKEPLGEKAEERVPCLDEFLRLSLQNVKTNVDVVNKKDNPNIGRNID